jgi:ribosomal protein S6
MPLYETIVITRVNTSRALSLMLKMVSSEVIGAGGNVRSARILSDRVLASPLRNQGRMHLLGRYVQLLYDGSPAVKRLAEQALQSSSEFMKVSTFRVADPLSAAETYLKPVQDSEVFASQEKEEMLRVLAAVRTREQSRHH